MENFDVNKFIGKDWRDVEDYINASGYRLRIRFKEGDLYERNENKSLDKVVVTVEDRIITSAFIEKND